MHWGTPAQHAHIALLLESLRHAGLDVSVGRAGFGVANIMAWRDAAKARRLGAIFAEAHHFDFEPLPQPRPKIHRVSADKKAALLGRWIETGLGYPSHDLDLGVMSDHRCTIGYPSNYPSDFAITLYRGTWDFDGTSLILYMGSTPGIWPRWRFRPGHDSKGMYLEMTDDGPAMPTRWRNVEHP